MESEDDLLKKSPLTLFREGQMEKREEIILLSRKF